MGFALSFLLMDGESSVNEKDGESAFLFLTGLTSESSSSDELMISRSESSDLETVSLSFFDFCVTLDTAA